MDERAETSDRELVLVFEDWTGRQVDFDLRGSVEEMLDREAPLPPPPPKRGPGRPRLGVVSREISLLPRHWEWLEEQPRGASAALRQLVDEARKAEGGEGRRRRAADAAGRFMSVVAGDRPGFEEAYRALYSGDAARFEELVGPWPDDIRAQVKRLADGAFAAREA